jgi:hypothetical protein
MSYLEADGRVGTMQSRDAGKVEADGDQKRLPGTDRGTKSRLLQSCKVVLGM